MKEEIGPTPGPWIVDFAREHLPGYRIVNAMHGLQSVDQETFQARHEANRALIEALPELRARLRRAEMMNAELLATCWLALVDICAPPHDKRWDTADKLRAAIAHAEDSTP